MGSGKEAKKTLKISLETWKMLSIVKAHLYHRSFDQTIRFLIRYYREHEKQRTREGEHGF